MSVRMELVRLFAAMDDEQKMARLFDELFTEKELNDLAMRWQLLKELYQGMTQRDIAARHKISLCKITRGSKILKSKDSVIHELLEEHFKTKE